MSEKKDEGWNIYGVRLDGKKPEIGIPEKLLNQQLDYSQPLPDPDLKNGKTVIYGRILGYDPTHGIALKFNCTDWLFFDVFGQSVPVAEDGSFRYETNMMLPGEATLRVGRKRFELFLMPGGKLEVTINLPEIFWSESHLFGKKENGQLIWFEGSRHLLSSVCRFGNSSFPGSVATGSWKTPVFWLCARSRLLCDVTSLEENRRP